MNPSIHAARVLPVRAVLFLGIAGFHALLAYLFASGLITQTIHLLRPDPPLEIFDVSKERTPEPATPPKTEALPTQFIAAVDPLPLPVINPMVDPPVTSEAPITTTTVAPLVDPPAPPPLRIVGRNVMPNTADYYPPNEIRMGYEGTTEIRSCVDAGGRLEGSPTVEATSGRASLDKAAVRLARNGRYARAMRGETAVANCYRFRVTFTLH